VTWSDVTPLPCSRQSRASRDGSANVRPSALVRYGTSADRAGVASFEPSSKTMAFLRSMTNRAKSSRLLIMRVSLQGCSELYGFVCHVWPKVKSRDLYCVRVYRSPWRFCLSIVGETAARGARSIGFIAEEGGPLRRPKPRRKPDVRREWIQITVWLKMGLGWHAFICHLDGRCCLRYIGSR
jgi:hypothetical protein